MFRIVTGFFVSMAAAAPLPAAADEPILPSRGEQLAATYCLACHTVPEPTALPRESWEFCLTYMGMFLGFHDQTQLDSFSAEEQAILEARRDFIATAELLPASPVISDEDWALLRRYYLEAAPVEAIPQIPHPAPVESRSAFRLMPTQYRRGQALTSLVHIDEERRQIILHDGLAEELTIMDRTGDIIATHPSPGVVLVDAQFEGNDVYLLSIGDLFASRIGEGFGELQRARMIGGQIYGLQVLLKDLHRSTSLDLADIDGDGFQDALIGNFGDYTGNLSLFRGTPGNRTFQPQPVILSAAPGIVAAEAFDFNADGRQDVVVLASHAREELSLLIQNPDGSFTPQSIVTQPSSFGYTGMLLRDFNDDGHMDIVTLNGDNGDSDPYNTLKAHHGIRIYLNRGGLKFEESYFYPMHGVFGAEIEDFDRDGDLDIAAIAFHPDFGQSPPENFVLLRQATSLQFEPITHPATYPGRWITIDSGDLDGDGDPDLILGAGYSPVGLRFKYPDLLESMMNDGPALLVLKNQLASSSD